MRFVLVICMMFCFSFSVIAQTESELSTEREILIYNFQSKIFSELQGIILDTLSAKFDCNELDLVMVSINDSIGCFNFSLSPVRGYIHTWFSEDDYASNSTYEYGFQMGESGITYLFKERDIDLLKQIGHLKKVSQTPFLPFVKELNNKCLNEENKKYSEVVITFDISYYFKNGLIVKPPSYYVRERNKH